MGCQCIQNNDNMEIDDQMTSKENSEKDIKDIEDENNNNSPKNDDLFNLRNQGWQVGNTNNENEENDQKRNSDEYLSRNTKYADYPIKMLEIINKIRADPKSYAEVIEDSIQNIIEVQNNANDSPKIIYKKKVKVALAKGEPAFTEAAEYLRTLKPLPPLELKNEICISIPENEEKIKDSTYLKEQIRILREKTNVDVFFNDLIYKLI